MSRVLIDPLVKVRFYRNDFLHFATIAQSLLRLQGLIPIICALVTSMTNKQHKLIALAVFGLNIGNMWAAAIQGEILLTIASGAGSGIGWHAYRLYTRFELEEKLRGK